MALPATDTFTAADGTYLTAYSASWTEEVANEFIIGSNSVYPNRAGSRLEFAYWNADSFDNNQYAQAVVAAIGSNHYMGVCVRVSGTSAYCAFWSSDAGLVLRKYVSGTPTDLGSSTAPSVSDVIRLEASGTSIVVKKNGTSVISVTDSSLTSGSAGICEYGGSNVTRLDTWEGGNLTTTASGAGSASGTGTASGTGQSTAGAPGSAAGVGAASGTGQSTAGATAAAAGTGAASGVGQSTNEAVGASSGVGAATGVGQSTYGGVGSSAGAGAASGTGQSTAEGVGSTSGTSTVSGVGENAAAGYQSGAGSAAGTSTVLGTAIYIIGAAGSGAGTCTVAAVGANGAAGSLDVCTATVTSLALARTVTSRQSTYTVQGC